MDRRGYWPFRDEQTRGAGGSISASEPLSGVEEPEDWAIRLRKRAGDHYSEEPNPRSLNAITRDHEEWN